MRIGRIVIGIILTISFLSLLFALGPFTGARRVGSTGKVAVIDVTGTITDMSDGPWSSGGNVRRITQHLADAREAADIDAVVLRINSGGGTAPASQEIYRSVLKVREAGKPVVVSMSEAGASGAYYIAAAADYIIANPSTLTGSIGVVTMFLNASELADEYGVYFETAKSGFYKDLGNPTRPVTEQEREYLAEQINDTFQVFVEAVAQGRGLSIDQVMAVADGRSFTGRQALELGLIDGLGGFEDAIEEAARRAGIEGRPGIVEFREPTPWLFRYFGLSASGARGLLSPVERGLLELVPGLSPGGSQPGVLWY